MSEKTLDNQNKELNVESASIQPSSCSEHSSITTYNSGDTSCHKGTKFFSLEAKKSQSSSSISCLPLTSKTSLRKSHNQSKVELSEEIESEKSIQRFVFSFCLYRVKERKMII
jgi:hypothetical protein